MKNTFNSFGQRLTMVREALGQTISSISRELKIPCSNLSRYERNITKPTIDFLERLIHVYHVNLNWLFGEEGQAMFLYMQKEILAPRKLVQSKLVEVQTPITFDEDFITMPILGEIAAGDPVEVGNTKPLGSVVVASQLLANKPEDFFVFRVNGNSMQPEINHEDVVFIYKNSDWGYLNNKIVAVRIEGEITLKKMVLDHEQHQIRFLPFNTAYDPIIVRAEESNDVTLIGELKSIRRTYRQKTA